MADQENPEERLQALHELRGAALVSALVRELGLLHRQVKELQLEMNAYRDFLAARDRWLETDVGHRQRVQLPRSVVIDASQGLYPRQGFYGLEYGEKGAPFSWTGPGNNFSFDIFVDRSTGAQLELRAMACMDFERQKDMRLLVNGESVAPAIVQHGRGLVLRATLPAADDDRGTNLIFTMPTTIRPHDSPDKRLLGIAFQSLTVSSLTDSRMERSTDTVVSLARQGARRIEDPEIGSPKVAADKAAS